MPPSAILLLALSAPLPFPRPAPPVRPGEYALTFHGHAFTYRLHACGELTGWPDGTPEDVFVGAWRQEGWTLHVTEVREGSLSPIGWSALLRGDGPVTLRRK